MGPENVWTHLVITVIATIPAILAGVASVLVSLRQLRLGKQTHTTVNGRVDQLVTAAVEKARLEEQLKHWQQTAFPPAHPAIVPPKQGGK